MWLLIACRPSVPLPDVCNGHADLCDRRFNEVALAATHNSMSNAEDGFGVPNQPDGLRAQMEAGIRGMLLDTYEFEGDLYFCHGYCEIGKLSMTEGLGEVKAFLDENPGEVMAFILQDDVTAEQTASAFSAAGLGEQVYTWQGGEWPTLGEMVAANTRLLVTAEVGGPPPEWYQHAWDLYFDTPYEFAYIEDFNCDLNRGAADNPLFLLNHWVENPIASQTLSAEANAYEVLRERASQCTAETGHIPNLVAVDWYSEGDLFAVVDALNGF